MKNILQIGRYTMFIKNLVEMNEEDEFRFFIIEEPDVLRKMKPFSSEMISQIIESKYHDSEEYMDVVKAWSKKIKFDAVVPGFEYCVKAANKAAQYLGLPRVGDKGARVFTNKILLRDLCEDIGIPQPRYQEINSMNQLKLFFIGHPIIFKPATRHASIGVIKINRVEEIESAYEETMHSTENVLVPDREIVHQYIAEDFIEGDEVSVECLVKNSEIVFFNITLKDKFLGKYFVESGHIVPGQVSEAVKNKIKYYKEKIIEAAEVENGVLHSEWILKQEIPHLVECAARIPGDNISELITNSYGFNFRRTFIDMMLQNNNLNINFEHRSLTAVRFFYAEPGKLKEIKNLDILNDEEHVVNWNISVKPGDQINKFRNSWDRIGYFMVKANSYIELYEIMDKITKKVVFEVV
ncbi:ATP-grasp domain-containing protein [Paenibacillus woosongensis]|uniref:ATP-grasp domain-containing protein n=1 Tax=Paenibacillus woosongensis TaxID=307580 RepID=A0AA95I2W9_9BACL|nr:ATP-grasp domain-containing protein [Paenibacillus woosongensis]WHX48531.1 ATP-grasp domain-containing protein [Paenibacillus woosongensis]